MTELTYRSGYSEDSTALQLGILNLETFQGAVIAYETPEKFPGFRILWAAIATALDPVKS